MSFPRILLVSVFLCAAASAVAENGDNDQPPPTLDESILTGNQHALWLIHPQQDGHYALLARPVGESWKWIDRQITREPPEHPPSAAVAVETRLHLVLTQPRAHLMYTLDEQRVPTRYPSHEHWPADAHPVALCSAEGLHKARADSLAAVVPLPAEPQTTDEDESQNNSDDNDEDNGADNDDQPPEDYPRLQDDGPPVLGVFQHRQGQWRWLGTIDVTPADEGRVFATVADGRMYVLVSPAKNGKNRLFGSVEDDDWEQLPLPEAAEQAYTAGMFTLGDRPQMVLGLPADESNQMRLVLATWREGSELSIQPIRIDQEEFTFDADMRPLASRLGDQAAIITLENEVPALTAVDAGGRGIYHGRLDIFDRPPPDQDGQRIMRYFMWGLAAAIIIPLIFLRPKTPPKPFALPGNMRPGPLVKRLVAALLDTIPFYVLASLLMLTQLPLHEFRDGEDIRAIWERFWEVSEQYALTTGAAYVLVATILLYLAYCVLMELRFSATLGKMAMGLRISGDEGAQPDLRGVLIRNLSKVIEMLWLFPVPVLLMWPVFNPNRQRIGDLIGRTTVIDARYRPPRPSGDEEATDHQQGPLAPPPPEQQDEDEENR